jgi:DNA-binding transcriptional ArsR family regulator
MGAEAVFDALGDPTRRQILRALSEGARPVGELADQLPVRRPAVSKHLRVLEGAGLVTYHAQGTRHLYALAPEGYAAAQQWFVETWDTVLDAFAAHLRQEDS